MSRQQRSRQRARGAVKQSALATAALRTVNAERNRNRVAFTAVRPLPSAAPLPDDMPAWLRGNHPPISEPSSAMAVLDEPYLTAIPRKPLKYRDIAPCVATDDFTGRMERAYNRAAAAAERAGITAHDESNGKPRDVGFRYVVYVSAVNVYAPVADLNNPAWNYPMMPSTAFSVAEYGQRAQSLAWDTVRTMRDNGHVVTLQRFHDLETAEPLTQGAARLRQSQWMNLKPADHAAAMEAQNAAETAATAARGSVRFGSDNRPPVVQRALSDGFIETTAVVVSDNTAR